MVAKRSESRGHIEERKPGVFTIWVSAGFDPVTKKRIRLTAKVVGNKTQAKQKLTDMLGSVDKGVVVKPSKLTVAEYLGRWLDTTVAAQVRARTAEGYRYIVERRLIPELGAVQLSALTPAHLQAYYAKARQAPRLDGKEGTLSGTSLLHHHRLLKQALSDAVKDGLVLRNVADAVDAPRPSTREMQTLDERDIDLFLNAGRQTPYYALWLVDLHTGLRRSEILALRWRDIDLERSTLSVTRGLHHLRDGRLIYEQPKSKKSKRQMSLGLTPVLALKGHREWQQADMAASGITWSEDTLVFCHHEDGRPLLPDSVSHAFIKMMKRAGLRNIRLHDLRHSHATMLLRAGIHARVVQERLGHSQVSITLDTYSHVLPDMDAQAVQKLEARLAARAGQKGGEQ